MAGVGRCLQISVAGKAPSRPGLWLRGGACCGRRTEGCPNQWEMGHGCTLSINRTSHPSPPASGQETCLFLPALSSSCKSPWTAPAHSPISRLPFVPLPFPIPGQLLTFSGEFRYHFLQEALLGSPPPVLLSCPQVSQTPSVLHRHACHPAL